MDNFILYDEIAKSESSIIYKGRRKGSINFVAIHCIEKHLRPEITNLVRLTYEMNHKNVVKFHEWYETSNHLWLVVELCTAGSLESIMEQDGCFPESSIKKFGIDLCEGLFYIHSIGVLFSDLNPRKIMVDVSGNLKLSDFGFAKLENEDLEAIFKETFESTSTQWSQSNPNSKAPKIYKKPFGNMKYIAPEIVLGEENSQESDLWSLGCMLYQMYTGSCPFVADDMDTLKNMILNKELPNPKGNKLSTKPSPEFLNLLKGLLEKDPSKR
jgi:serine/threonine-protein kinase ULK4